MTQIIIAQRINPGRLTSDKQWEQLSNEEQQTFIIETDTTMQQKEG
jgi:hypothetical protein